MDQGGGTGASLEAGSNKEAGSDTGAEPPTFTIPALSAANVGTNPVCTVGERDTYVCRAAAEANLADMTSLVDALKAEAGDPVGV